MLAAWAGSEWGDDSGRWRMLELNSTIGRRRAAGELWRTPNGALLVLHQHNEKRTVAIEYSPDGGCFRPIELPGWTVDSEPIPQGWTSPERVLGLKRLLAERGPVPADVGKALELAGRTGMGTLSALRLCFGDRLGRLPTDRSAIMHGRSPDDAKKLPPEIIKLIRTIGEEEETDHGLSYPQVDLFRERLMPEDPADLWTTGPDIARAGDWWLARRS
jgi:hypothetical protein